MTFRDTSVWPSLRLCVRRSLWYILAAVMVDGKPPYELHIHAVVYQQAH